jgi:DNA-binding NtrC family response regulator
MPRQQEATVRVELERGRCLISRSAELERIWQLVQRVAPTDASVLITGETGTGKELIARLIHRMSGRAHQEFLAVDCNAIAPSVLESELFGHERGAFTGADRQQVGVFELADRATLFLDEIGNLPLAAQAKLLRVLQEREFRRLGGTRVVRSDFRLISATNSDLAAGVADGSFRGDLFHRLKVVHVHLPPLRERREDVELLVGYLVKEKRVALNRPAVCRVDHRALGLLLAYDWPGNVRELENVIETAMIECTGETIAPDHVAIGLAMAPAAPARAVEVGFREARQEALATFERVYLIGQLSRHRGSVKQVALHAGITPKHVRELLHRHGIDRRTYRVSASRSVSSSR